MSRLILYAGPNGAGKSTLRDMGNDDVELVIDPDRIARAQSLENLPKAIALANRVIVIDNSGPQRRFLLRSDSGRVVELAADPPRWFVRLWPDIRSVLNRS
jgi:predicted ABC-type ATPase